MSTKDDKDSDVKDEASGCLSNNIETQDASERDSNNQGGVESELPPTLDIPMIPPMNVTLGQILYDISIQPGVIVAPALNPTTIVARQVAVINSSNDAVS